jgi:hypothetical protein
MKTLAIVAAMAGCIALFSLGVDLLKPRGVITVTADRAGILHMDGDEVGAIKLGEPLTLKAKHGVVDLSLVTDAGELFATSALAGEAPAAVQIARGSFTDPRDGEVYPYVHAGGSRWMGEGLRHALEGSKCAGDAARCSDRRYTLAQASRACPEGWRVPSSRDWQRLAEQLGGCDNCPDIRSVDPRGAGERMAREPDLGLMMGFERYWVADSGSIGALMMALSYTPGGEHERTMTESERRDAKWRERQRPEPATLNERRKRDARLKAKVSGTHGDSVEARLVSSYAADDDAALRCVAD